MDNPLAYMTGLPSFSAIRPEHVEPAIDRVLAENRARVNELLESNEHYTWDNLVQPLEELEDRLSRVWSPVSHMNAVMNTPELREAYNACLPKLTEYATELGQDPRLYAAHRQIADGDEYQQLTPAQRKVVDNALRDFRLSGVELEAAERERFKVIQQELASLSSRFEENVLDATHAWKKHITDPAQLAGLPETALGLARQTAEREGLEGYLLTLEFPSFQPVMTYADDRTLRREVYEAYVTRASDTGPHAGQWDNSDNMERILALRHETAQLLGYESYAHLSLATKMARTPEEVAAFLNDLAQRARPAAAEELAELRAFARDEDGLDELEAWDIAYYAERLRHKRFQLSQEELRPYFPAPKVIQGLFDVVNRLYGLKIQQHEGVDVWHPDVRFYEIHDADGHLRGQFYLDLYSRPQKRGGAWMDECVTRMRTVEGVQVPVAYLTCNFSQPVGDRPSLLTHDDVLTLFHEFGHGLHHMLTQVDYPSIAGINGVAWDAVELPSQFMENWCWEREALDLIAGHHETGAPLPDELFERLKASRNFHAAMQLMRQLEFSLFDFRLHWEYDPRRGGRIMALLEEVRQQVAVIRPPSFNRFPHGFAHIFAGGYAAGYYSYKWAEVLSADAFEVFAENGIFHQPSGERFLKSILEQGGSRDAMELFVDFRGREPGIEALLRQSGLAA